MEGEIPPKTREQEGPFSEFQDYYLTGAGMNPIVNIKAVTMRGDAIFKNVQNGTEVEGCVYHKSSHVSANFTPHQDRGWLC